METTSAPAALLRVAKRTETQKQRVKRKVETELERKRKRAVAQDCKERQVVKKVTEILVEEALPSKTDRTKELVAAYLAGWDRRDPDFEEWGKAKELQRLRNDRRFQNYLKMHQEYKTMLPRADRVALGSDQRKRKRSQTPWKTVSFRSTSSNAKVHTLADAEATKEKETDEDTGNSMMVKTYGGYWDIRFIPD